MRPYIEYAKVLEQRHLDRYIKFVHSENINGLSSRYPNHGFYYLCKMRSNSYSTFLL